MLTFAAALAPGNCQTTGSASAQQNGIPASLPAFVELFGQMLRSGEDALRRVSAASSERAWGSEIDSVQRVKYVEGLRKAEADESAPPATRAMLREDIAAAEQAIQQMDLERDLAKERTDRLESLAGDFQSADATVERMKKGLENHDAQTPDNLSSSLCGLTRVARELQRNQLLLTQAVLAASTSDWLLEEAAEKHFVTALGNILEDPNIDTSEHDTSQISREIHSAKADMLQAKLASAQQEQAALELRMQQLKRDEQQSQPCAAVTLQDLSSEVAALTPILQQMAGDWEQARSRVVQDEIVQIDGEIEILTHFQEVLGRYIDAWQRDPGSDPMPVDKLDPPIAVRIEKLQQKRKALVKMEAQLRTTMRAGE